jgi:uncharacterized alkaline shock family protein YloU
MDTMINNDNIGNTSVSTEVLSKIARLTTLSVDGVSRMENCFGGLEKLVGSEDCKGVKVQIKDGAVFVDVYVILMSNMNIRDISREIQSRVSRTISEMVGMHVGGVNVHIIDIDFNS